jgi:hypothetical protein
MRSVSSLCVVLFALSACARYEFKNELDVPELCGYRGQSLPYVPRPVRQVSLDSLGRLAGSVLMPPGQGLTDAFVRLFTADGLRPAHTDTTGRFVLDSVSAGRYGYDVRRVGFNATRDSIVVVAHGAPPWEIMLQPSVFDGPCSGFAAVRVRKPWWKIW